MTPLSRKIFELRFLEKLSFDEIAYLLAIERLDAVHLVVEAPAELSEVGLCDSPERRGYGTRARSSNQAGNLTGTPKR